MKTALLSILVLSLLTPNIASAAFYQWTDTSGVVHLTDDPDKIPKAYRDKAKSVEVFEDPKPSGGVAPAPQVAPQATSPTPAPPGGHDERWWRQRFSGLRVELKALQDARTEKEQRLEELRRKRVIFQRARDRGAVNALQSEMAADEARISEVLNRIAALELAAAKAGVPAEWLR